MIDKNKNKMWYFETDSDKIEEMYKTFIRYMLDCHWNMAIEMMNNYVDNNCKKHRCPICGKELPLAITEWYDVVDPHNKNVVLDSICEDCLDKTSVVDIYIKTRGIYGLF